MRNDEPNPASAKEQAEGSRENVNLEDTGGQKQKNRHASSDDFESGSDLPGKTDSGPEPDVFGQELPPQK